MTLGPLGWLLFWAVFHTVPGQDWVVFHTAAALFRAHDVTTLADPRAFTDTMNRTHADWFPRPISVLHPWVYPPVTLVLALAFGWLPYMASLLAFLAVSISAMLAALWPWQARAREKAMLLGFVLLCPATAFAIGAGQLSFLIAAAVMAGLWFLDTRPVLAGACFSLLCLKPQYVPLIPVALLAGRYWRAVLGGILGGATLVIASAAITGVGAWLRWIDLATGANPLLGKLIDVVRVYDQSVHTCLRMLGFSDGVAGVGQMAAVGVAATCIAVTFARRPDRRQRAIVLLLGLVAGAPHVGDYDFVLVAIAVMLVLLDQAPRPSWEITLASCCWLVPLFNPPALIAVLHLPVLTAISALTNFLPLCLLLSETLMRRQPAPALATAANARTALSGSSS